MSNFIIFFVPIIGLVIGAFLLNFYWLKMGWAAYLPLIMLPLGAKVAWQVYKNEPSEIFNKFLAQAALLHLGFGLLFSVGLLLR